MSKKFLALSISMLVLSGTFFGISSASAATAYKTCSPAKAKTSIGGLSYTCSKNPAKASKKLVWVAKPCIVANKNYKSARSMTKANSATTAAALNAATRSITANERQLAMAQKNVDTWTKNMSSYPANPTAAEAKQIALVQEGIDRNKERVLGAQAAIDSLQAQVDAAKAEESKNAGGLSTIKKSLKKACK